MFRVRYDPRILLIAGLTVPALAAGGESRPTTRPAAQELSVSVWTCPTHQQFRLFEQGQCPLGDAELVRSEVTIEGAEALGDPYTLTTCPVSGRDLGTMGPPIVMMHQGREVRFCCAGCISKFEADAAGHFAKIDKQIIEQQLAAYPLTSCPVSQKPLGEMGDPVDYVYNNRLVRFCCKGCLRGFKKDPAPVLATLDAAVIAAQLEDYPYDTCPISQRPLDSMGNPINYVVANRLVRFCCAGCLASFYKDPAPHLAKLDQKRGKSGT